MIIIYLFIYYLLLFLIVLKEGLEQPQFWIFPEFWK